MIMISSTGLLIYAFSLHMNSSVNNIIIIILYTWVGVYTSPYLHIIHVGNNNSYDLACEVQYSKNRSCTRLMTTRDDTNDKSRC